MARSSARVVGGRLAGRRLRSPAAGTRPATAIIRSAIFDRPDVRERIEDGTVLDLYAGAGYLGIEAMSRGSAWVDFVERAGPACAVIRRNLAELGLTEYGRVHRMPVERCFSRIASRADVAFVDPPYGVDARRVVDQLDERGVLEQDGLLLWRRRIGGVSALAPPPDHIGGLLRIDLRRYGDGAIDVYRHA